jgi:hypothetical protein
MVAKPGAIQYSWNAGELEPGAAGRADIKQYYAAAKEMTNVEPRPQGGFRLLPRSRDIAYVRGGLEAVEPTSVVTDPGPFAGPATVIQLNFTAPETVILVDILNYFTSYPGNLVDNLQIQWLDGAAWQAYSPAFDVSNVTQNRRFAKTPGSPITTTSLRLQYLGGDTAGHTFSVAGIYVYRDAGLGPGTFGRQFAFNVSATDAYTLIVTPGNGDIFKGPAYVGSVSLPYSTQAQINELRRTQRLETLFLWHKDFPPYRIVRVTADSEWESEPVPFTNMPEVDYGGSYTKTNDIWRLNITWSEGDGSGIWVNTSVNGEDCEALYTADAAFTGFTAALAAAIHELPSVEDTGVVVSDLYGGATFHWFQIEFSGANAGKRFAMTARAQGGTGIVGASMTHQQFGDVGGEPLESASRGYASCGCFNEDRLWQGGFRSKPGAMLASVTAEYFDLNDEIESASSAVLINLDQDGADEIQHLVNSRFLTIFTSSAEYYVSTRPVSRQQPINIVNSSRYGSARYIPPVDQEGSLLYVNAARTIVYAATYSDMSQVIESQPVSLLASHLVQGVAAVGLQKSSISTAADRYWMARGIEGATAAILIRGQEVAAFVRWRTDGDVLDVSVDGLNRCSMIVLRTIGGVQRACYEILEDGLLLDQAFTQTFGAATTVVAGLQRLEGATVWAIADGFPDGPFVVAEGTITLHWPSTVVTVGRWTAPRAETLSPTRLVAERTQVKKPQRIAAVRGELNGTQSLAIAANGGPVEDVPLSAWGGATDLAGIAPKFGPFEKTGIRGFSNGGTVLFTQLRPGALDLRDITVEAK